MDVKKCVSRRRNARQLNAGLSSSTVKEETKGRGGGGVGGYLWEPIELEKPMVKKRVE
jgi:hypothetical protein